MESFSKARGICKGEASGVATFGGHNEKSCKSDLVNVCQTDRKQNHGLMQQIGNQVKVEIQQDMQTI